MPSKPKINTGQQILGDFNSQNKLLLNVYYSRGNREYNVPDVCTFVYKDTTTKEKHMMEWEHPLMKMYVVKEEFRDDSFYPETVPRSHCDVWMFPYREVLSQIYRLASPHMRKFVDWCRETGNYYSMKKLHHTPCVLASDFPYENYFRIEWLLNYAQKDLDMSITKQYLDIEVDSISVPGMPENGNCPINAVTIVDQELMQCFTFLLRNPENPLIAEFEAHIDDFIGLCHQSFDESYGRLEYNIYMYDEELELISNVFRLINTMKRDFLLIWNLPFDIPYIMDRLVTLGQDPRDYMCHPDFRYPYCWFRKDRRNFDFKTRRDIFRCASYTIFQDQMTNYAKVRKGQAELPSLKLNAIAKSELNDEKLDYTDEANIKTLPYVDYVKFVLYNIKDVLLQFGIERKVKDLEAIFQRAYDNATDYDSIFSQTIFLKNRVFLDYYRELDLIQGNNVNIKYDSKKDDEEAEKETDPDQEYELDADGEPDYTRPISKGFEGALVGNPLNNSYEGKVIYGKKSMFIFDYVIDFDSTTQGPCTRNGTMQSYLIAGKSPVDNQQPSFTNVKKAQRLSRKGVHASAWKW